MDGEERTEYESLKRRLERDATYGNHEEKLSSICWTLIFLMDRMESLEKLICEHDRRALLEIRSGIRDP